MFSRGDFEKQMKEENMGFDLSMSCTAVGYANPQTEMYYSVWIMGHVHCLEKEYNDSMGWHEFVEETYGE